MVDRSEADGQADGEAEPVEGLSRRRVVGTLFLIVFIDLLGFGILIPVIPLYAKFLVVSQTGLELSSN